MRITNTTPGPITINCRTGASFVVPAGGYVVRPSSELDYLDDTKVTLAQFSSGALVLANDDGSAWSGAALPGAPSAPPASYPLLVTTSGGGMVIEDGVASRGFVTAEMAAGVPTGNFS